MADKHAVLELGDEDLQFSSHDYSTQGASSGLPSSTPAPQPSSTGEGGEAEPGSGSSSANFWSLSYYQQCFDVEDKDVLSRLLYSMLPIPGKSFLQHHIRPKPDLYGPFWICVTLIFSIAISGNLADYLSTSLTGQASWHYDFHKVTLASTAVFSYAGLIPACLYGYLWWAGQGGTITISFLELLCLYGYSVTIYIPISILWLLCVKVGWLQWVLVLVGASLSGAVLFTTVWPAIRENAAKSAGIVIIVILSLHFLLATGFMLYFFHSGASASSVIVPVPEDAKLNQTQNETLPDPAALLQSNIGELSTGSPARVEKNADPGENTNPTVPASDEAVDNSAETVPADGSAEDNSAETVSADGSAEDNSDKNLNQAEEKSKADSDYAVVPKPAEAEKSDDGSKIAEDPKPADDPKPVVSSETVAGSKSDDKDAHAADSDKPASTINNTAADSVDASESKKKDKE